MIKLDLTGRRFGRLTVLHEDPVPYRSPAGKPTRRWVCRCDCGSVVTILQSALTTTKNPTLSCGCLHAEKRRAAAQDMTGQRFGRLVVIGSADLPEKLSNGQRLGWRCRCDCGNEIIKTRKDLLSGKILSCGCLLKEQSSETVRQKVKQCDGTNLTAINPDRGANKNSKSGIKGVYWSSREGCWIAKIGFQNRTITLGRFANIDDAISARKEAEEEYFKPMLEKHKEDSEK